MKQLTCEMCGGTDLMKDGGAFVCRTCGCKYSVEEAKKMMLKDIVDVSGSNVKVDTSSELKKLYQVARRAKEDNNSEGAAKYYEMILLKDPTSWEAYFYATYFKAMGCTYAQISSAAISVRNCQNSVLEMIRNYVPKEKQEAAVSEVIASSIWIANMLAKGSNDHYAKVIDANINGNALEEYAADVRAAREILYTCGSEIDRIFKKEKKLAGYAAVAWKAGIDLHDKFLSWLVNGFEKDITESYVRKIGKYDPAYVKKYTYNEKRKQLKAEIEELEFEISNTPTERSRSEKIGFFMLWYWLVMSSIFLFASFGCLANEDEVGIGVVLLLVGVILVSFWAIMIKKSNAKLKERCENANLVRAELAKKEKEWNELTKKES